MFTIVLFLVVACGQTFSPPTSFSYHALGVVKTPSASAKVTFDASVVADVHRHSSFVHVVGSLSNKTFNIYQKSGNETVSLEVSGSDCVYDCAPTKCPMPNNTMCISAGIALVDAFHAFANSTKGGPCSGMGTTLVPQNLPPSFEVCVCVFVVVFFGVLLYSSRKGDVSLLELCRQLSHHGERHRFKGNFIPALLYQLCCWPAGYNFAVQLYLPPEGSCAIVRSHTSKVNCAGSVGSLMSKKESSTRSSNDTSGSESTVLHKRYRPTHTYT